MTTENMAGGDIVALDARAVQATVGVVSQLSPADLGRPTPCPAGLWQTCSRT